MSTATASGSAGIVTERDILHGLVEHGTTPLNKEGGDIMTRKGITATPTADVGTLMGLVTKRRCRYIPAKKDKVLSGIISIGALLKSRLEQVKREANQLRNYIARR